MDTKSFSQWSRPNINCNETFYTLNFPISFTKSLYCILYGELTVTYNRIRQLTDLVFYSEGQNLSSSRTESIIYYPDTKDVEYDIGYVYTYFIGV